MPSLVIRRITWLSSRFLGATVAATLLLSVNGSKGAQAAQGTVSTNKPLTVVTVGGGPDYAHDQVAIESNVRYVNSLLPPRTPNTILFTNGDAQSPTVQYTAKGKALTPEEEAFRILFRQSGDTSLISYRTPNLPPIAGPAQHSAFQKVMGDVAGSSDKGPLLLYFTGHGSPNKDSLDNNYYDLWNESGLTVQELSKEIARLPANRPVILIMVECFSGAFGNILFEGGDPRAELISRPFCGFFATTNDRVAAGCTPEVNEENYRDFTSYFFAALTGRNRLGRTVPLPDFNKDGKVGMDEAMAYAQIESPTIDVPLATSDVFLRRFVTVSDDEIGTASWQHVVATASPAQKAALEGISRHLGDETPDRLVHALKIVKDDYEARKAQSTRSAALPADQGNPAPPPMTPIRRMRLEMENRFGGLQGGLGSSGFANAQTSALEFLKAHPDLTRQILTERDAQNNRRQRRVRDAGSNANLSTEDRIILSLRLVRLANSVLLEEKLRAGGDTQRIGQFDQIKRLEAGNPLRNS